MKTTRRDALKSALSIAAAGLAPGAAVASGNGHGDAAVTQGAGQGGPLAGDPNPLASLSDYEIVARERMSHAAYEYIAGGAGDDVTNRANREAYDRIRLNPSILVDVSKLDTRVSLFGHELAFPILMAPTAYHRMVHPEGEIATARGASAAGAILIVSSFATATLEEIAAVARTPLWFQLYVHPDRGFTRELVQRAEGNGFRALCLTVDTPLTGARNRQARVGFSLPAGVREEVMRRADGSPMRATFDASLSWKDIGWLRSFARVPLLLKGVLNPDDAARGIDAGAAGIIVSNHGGRNLDTAPATIDALPRVVERVQGRIPVLVDGGIRRGTDVLKAIALGATATLIGRSYLYGLAVNGADGVAAVVNILRREFEMAMALAGRPTIASIDRSVLWPAG